MSDHLLKIIREQHQALDWCLARIGQLDRSFVPSTSPAWPAVLSGAAAIARAERKTTTPAPAVSRELFHRMGLGIQIVAHGIENETGDRAYLRSTNDADKLKDLASAYLDWCIETGDTGEDIDR